MKINSLVLPNNTNFSIWRKTRRKKTNLFLLPSTSLAPLPRGSKRQKTDIRKKSSKCSAEGHGWPLIGKEGSSEAQDMSAPSINNSRKETYSSLHTPLYMCKCSKYLNHKQQQQNWSPLVKLHFHIWKYQTFFKITKVKKTGYVFWGPLKGSTKVSLW